MRARQVTLKPSQDTEQAARQIRLIWYLFCWSILWRGKVLPGQAVVSPTELLTRFRWSADRWAGPVCCWENIGVRPFPSASTEEKYGPRSVEISLISALMRLGPMNSQVNTPFTGSSIHRSFSMHCRWQAEIWKKHRPCSGLSRKPWSRPWDAHSISWIRCTSLSIHLQKEQQTGTARIPFRCACQGRPW